MTSYSNFQNFNMNQSQFNRNNRPYTNTNSFKRPITNNQQQYPNYNQYNSGNVNYRNNSNSSNRIFPSAEMCQNRNVRTTISDYNNFGDIGNSQYTDNPDQFYQANNGCADSYGFGYFNNQANGPAPSQQNTRNYSTFRQFRQHYKNREKKPKKPTESNTAAPSLFMGKDPSYPDELNNLMNPFCCGLCSARLNSIKSANIHYESKAHDRHITSWIKKTYTEKGLDPPKLHRFVTEVSIEPPGVFRCELCQLELTSAQHALQHYNGKRHRLAATKVCPPTGIGYFNMEGQWVKTGIVIDKVTGKETSYILVKTPSGFEPVVLQVAPNSPPGTKVISDSESAKNEEPPTKKAHIETNKTESNDDKEAKLKAKQEEHYRSILGKFQKPSVSQTAIKSLLPDSAIKNQYRSLSLHTEESKEALQTPEEAIESCQCKICGVPTTSKDQMLLHLKGQRHSKKLKQLGEVPFSERFQGSTATILQSLGNSDPLDTSMYRTPSGSYYCKMCDVAVENVAYIKTHISSKKHLTAIKNNAAEDLSIRDESKKQ